MTEKLIRLESLAADLSREREGEWIDVKEWHGLDPDNPLTPVKLPGLAFHVKSLNDDAFVAAQQKAMEAEAEQYRDHVPPDVSARRVGRLAAEHLLLGWRGLDVAYSPETAAQVVAAEEHRVMRQMIAWCAQRVGKRRIEFLEAGAKN